ncbi:MAG: KUP/HAK/KT family potassium transporter, partial [Acidimicrobiia bacterium]|nr:KUP/HAK/KT family potassium transporter [Acidimicrobiia bacterium]
MSNQNGHPRGSGPALALAALGVVYGDIGTSPLYAFRESLRGGEGIPVVETNILGVLSLMVWSLIIVVTVKYLLLVLRADNHGEGGILALTALILPRTTRTRPRRLIFVVIGLFGTALLYGDGMITPAISVLSAVEGVSLAAPAFDHWVIPLAVVILVA